MKKVKITTEKVNLHPRNKHRLGYDFEQLIQSCPELNDFVFTNQYETQTIDFSNSDEVKLLNKALLISEYEIHNWDIPKNYLCPPLPGRADYIHYIADLLTESNNGILPKGDTIEGLDIGIGANCIYPIIGNTTYGWSFVGSDIDEKALQNQSNLNTIQNTNNTLFAGSYFGYGFHEDGIKSSIEMLKTLND